MEVENSSNRITLSRFLFFLPFPFRHHDGTMTLTSIGRRKRLLGIPMQSGYAS
jgi:hypothetical protein